MRFTSCLIIGIFCFLFFALVSDVLPKNHNSNKGSHYYHYTDSTIWWAEAWASAYAGESGYFHTWCHVGSGPNDYKGGSFQGAFYESSSSAAVNNAGQPSPYWVSSYCN